MVVSSMFKCEVTISGRELSISSLNLNVSNTKPSAARLRLTISTRELYDGRV